jgi:hypothetical protein
MTQKLGVYNVNGGGATRTNDTPSLTRASAMGIPQGNGAFQVFAPVENENVYTNDWHGPFYGYRHAIETFELNETPRRLSIITIYYHFYSGAKTASLVALKEVYDWALKQETTPLYLSEYAANVIGFQRATVARRITDGAWEFGNLGELRTVRLDAAAGWPDLTRSRGVAGVRDTPQGRYVHLVPGAPMVLALGTSPPSQPYLENANGRVMAWHAEGAVVRFRIKGDVPIAMSIAGTSRACEVRSGPRVVAGARMGAVTRFSFASTDTGEATLECH